MTVLLQQNTADNIHRLLPTCASKGAGASGVLTCQASLQELWIKAQTGSPGVHQLWMIWQQPSLSEVGVSATWVGGTSIPTTQHRLGLCSAASASRTVMPTTTSDTPHSVINGSHMTNHSLPTHLGNIREPKWSRIVYPGQKVYIVAPQILESLESTYVPGWHQRAPSFSAGTVLEGTH